MSEKTRLLLISEPASGGVRRHVADLIQGLDPAVYEITLIYGESRQDQAFLAAKPLLEQKARLIPLPALEREISPSRDLRAFLEIGRIIRQIKPDVVHCHSSKAGALGRPAARLLGVRKIFYTPHAYAFLSPGLGKKERWLYEAAERFLTRFCTTRVFHVSQGEQQNAIRADLGPRRKLTVIHNGIPAQPYGCREEARRELGCGPEDFVVGCTARMDRQKNPLAFVEIARRACAALPMRDGPAKLRFVWIGDGELMEQTLRAVKEGGLEDRVFLPGSRSDGDRLVEAFDLYLSTARYEGLSYSLLEASRAGVPIAATDVVGNSETVSPGVNGWLFPAGDLNAGARVVKIAMEEYQPNRGAIQRDFAARFSLEKMLSAVCREYQR